MINLRIKTFSLSKHNFLTKYLRYFFLIPIVLCNLFLTQSPFPLFLIPFNIIYMVSFSDDLVESAKKLAWRFHISIFFLGMVIIPCLSNLHELIVSIIGLTKDMTLAETVLAQQLGNKLFELLVSFGLLGWISCRTGSCIKMEDESERKVFLRNGVFVILAAIILAILVFSDLSLDYSDGFILIMFYVTFLIATYFSRKGGTKEFESISEEMLGEYEGKEFKPSYEVIKFIVFLMIIMTMGNFISENILVLRDNYDFFMKYNYIIVGLLLALPNLIISAVSLKKGMKSLMIALSIGSAMWEMTISIAIYVIISPINNISFMALMFLTICLIFSALIAIIYIRTHWMLKLWESITLIITYVIMIIILIAI